MIQAANRAIVFSPNTIRMNFKMIQAPLLKIQTLNRFRSRVKMGMLKGDQMISRGIPSLTLIGASVNSWTVLGWLMCSTGCRSMGRPVNSVSAFVNQQLLTHIAMQRKEPTQGPRGISRRQCAVARLRAQASLLDVRPSRHPHRVWFWQFGQKRGHQGVGSGPDAGLLHSHDPSTSSRCACLSADISSMRLTLCWETQQMACRGHMATAGQGGERLQYWL